MSSFNNKRHQSTPRLVVATILLLFVINVESSLHSGQRHVPAVWAVRGGANDDGEDVKTDNGSSATQQEQQNRTLSSSLLSLFQWNDQIKFQAQQQQQLPLRLRNHTTKVTTEDNVAASRQRGGALVATATKPSRTSRFHSWWWSPLLGDRVASRLTQVDTLSNATTTISTTASATAAAKDEEAISNKTSRTGVSSWWMSTRSSMLPEQKQQSSEKNMTSVREDVEEKEEELSGDEEAEERKDMLRLRSISNEEEKDEDTLKKKEEASVKVSSKGADVPKTLPHAGTVPTIVPINATALSTRQRTWTASPYESSGYVSIFYRYSKV